MTTALRLLVLAILILPAGSAAAQTLPWPGEPGASVPPAKSWPNDAPQGPAPGIFPRTGASPKPCMAEFAALRKEVENKGIAAKAAGQKHVPWKEMCKLITSYADSEGWGR
jgi:hypothetical protein